MTFFQKTALAALLATLLLIFVGAIVRVSGAGLGCPDWPKCWGSMWPPSSVEEVNFDNIDMEKFRRKDPDITREKLAAEFNATHVWIEYINRLTSLPVGLFTLGTFLLSFRFVRKQPSVSLGALLAVVLVGVNAILGAIVVSSGLKPGVITIHMAMAIALLCVLVFVVHRGGETRPRFEKLSPILFWLTLGLFVSTVAEGVMGSQVREVTDQLALEFKELPRADWHETLEAKPIYLFHRSFSWAILILAGLFFWKSKAVHGPLAQASRLAICGIVLAQMVLGIFMAHISVAPVVQVLHIGLSSILVIALFWFLLCSRRSG